MNTDSHSHELRSVVHVEGGLVQQERAESFSTLSTLVFEQRLIEWVTARVNAYCRHKRRLLSGLLILEIAMTTNKRAYYVTR